MVCLTKPLPRVIDSVNFCRGDWHRAFFYQDHVGLEKCVESSDSGIDLDCTDFYKCLMEELSMGNFIIKTGIDVFILSSLMGVMYGAVKLLQYYNIIEKYVPQ